MKKKGLFSAESIDIEDKSGPTLPLADIHKVVDTFRKGISPRMNAIASLEF